MVSGTVSAPAPPATPPSTRRLSRPAADRKTLRADHARLAAAGSGAGRGGLPPGLVPLAGRCRGADP